MGRLEMYQTNHVDHDIYLGQKNQILASESLQKLLARVQGQDLYSVAQDNRAMFL